MNIAIFGATGYTGSLLLKLAAAHPHIYKIFAFSNSITGNETEIKSEKIFSGKYLSYNSAPEYHFEVIFSALPHLSSSEYYLDYIGSKVIIDLAADLRLNNKEVFEKNYGKLPAAEKFFGTAEYGLSEFYHEGIEYSNLIANPGCYPTAALLAVLPVVKEFNSITDIIINSMSGLSGAGKKANTDLLFSERADNVNVYSPGNSHRHHSEIFEKISKYKSGINLSFNPHLIPVNRGIYSDCTIITNEVLSYEKVSELLNDTYSAQPFVNILPLEKLQLKDVVATNNCNISFSVNGNHLHIFSCLDNLMKGAAGAAIQNFNIRFGYPETSGLPTGNLL